MWVCCQRHELPVPWVVPSPAIRPAAVVLAAVSPELMHAVCQNLQCRVSGERAWERAVTAGSKCCAGCAALSAGANWDFSAVLLAGSTSPRCWAAGPILCLGAHRTPARAAIKPRSRCFQRSASCNRLGSSPSGGFPTPGSGPWRAAYGDGWRAKTLGPCRSAPGRDVLSRRARGTLMVAVSTTLLRRPQWHQKLTV